MTSKEAMSAIPANLGDLLHGACELPAPALIDLRVARRSAVFTRQELANAVQRFAASLADQGIGPGQRIGFLAENRWELLAGYLGTMYLGAVAVPVNYQFTAETIRHICRDAGLAVIYHDEPRQSLVPDDFRAAPLEEFAAFAAENSDNAAAVDPYQPRSGDLAEILYTSGSTGLPKGVPLSHAGQLWALSKYIESPDARNVRRRSLIVAPLYHMNALFYSSICLLNAVTIVLQPRFRADAYVEALREYRCTDLSGVPTMFALVAALERDALDFDRSFVEKIGVGSAPLSYSLLARMRELFSNAEITNGYGTTEAGPAVFGRHPLGKPRPPMSVGYPFEDVCWRLTGGETANEGLLELATPAMTPGYLQRPEANAERFHDGWFKTNDVMRRDEDGFFYFISRADDMFVCGGENIYPGEVEALLNRHPAVRESLVVSAPDDIKGMVPIAFVVPSPEADASEQVLKTYCLEHGPAYAHPRRIVFKSSLPVGGTHKIDRRTLEREARELMVADGRTTET